YTYDPFGNLRESLERIDNKYKYAGQQYDQITDQYYLRSRYYAPQIGRFIQEDAFRGDGLNLYAYVANNPLKYVDPSGYAKDGVTDNRHYPRVNDPEHGMIREEMEKTSDVFSSLSDERTDEDETENPITEFVANAVEKYNNFADDNFLLRIPKVSAEGLSGDLVLVTGSVQFIGDTRGNIGMAFTGGFKAKSDIEGGVGVSYTYSNNMESVEDMNGTAPYFGGGVDLGEGIGISVDYTYSPASTDDGRQVTAHTVGVGGNVTFVPAEIHTGVAKTKVYKINVFDKVYKIYKKIFK
ncbi:MAG: RHS repeat-associated core domain-containing protein, partial [Maledivibacter sp.]|nr:RHS repeat-associated core domain-containing protein [Maledivibacter sp.]